MSFSEDMLRVFVETARAEGKSDAEIERMVEDYVGGWRKKMAAVKPTATASYRKPWTWYGDEDLFRR